MTPFLHIRTRVFGVSQSGMADLARVSQATVSRWEAGAQALNMRALANIRSAAAERGLVWDDSWLFQCPEAAE